MQSSTAVFLRAAVMLGVLVVLPAYALLGTSLPDKLLPLVDHLATSDEPPAGGDARRPPTPTTSNAAAAPHAALWSADMGVDRTPEADYPPRRVVESSEDRTRNRLVSWEQAAPRSPAQQQSPSSTATVRVSDHGRRVLPPDGFTRRSQALWEVGATRITVSVEYTGHEPTYWCSCQVVDRRERFEADAASALGAMDKVLEQIHAWRSAAAPPRR